MAQILRAILFASAMSTSIFGFLASIRASQEAGAGGLRRVVVTCDIAPMIKSRRMSAWPAFDTRPSRSLASGRELPWHKSKPCRKVESPSWMAGEPFLDLVFFVSGIVVEDHMDRFAC